MSLSTAASSTVSATSSAVSAGFDARSINFDEWEKERSTLYQQLDEKVINTVVLINNIKNEIVMRMD